MDCLDSLKTGHTPKYISVEARGTDAIPRLRDLGYSGFKGISQLYFFPIDLNYCPEEAEFQRLSHWMYGRNPLLKAARRLGDMEADPVADECSPRADVAPSQAGWVVIRGGEFRPFRGRDAGPLAKLRRDLRVL